MVFKGRNKKTGMMGAVKIMDAVIDKEEHENIVDCYGVYLKRQDRADDQLWIVMEVYMIHTSLNKCIY